MQEAAAVPTTSDDVADDRRTEIEQYANDIVETDDEAASYYPDFEVFHSPGGSDAILSLTRFSVIRFNHRWDRMPNFVNLGWTAGRGKHAQ